MYMRQVDRVTGISQFLQYQSSCFTVVIRNFSLQPYCCKDSKQIERPRQANGSVETKHRGSNACCPDASPPYPDLFCSYSVRLKEFQTFSHANAKQPAGQTQRPIQPRTIRWIVFGSRMRQYHSKR